VSVHRKWVKNGSAAGSLSSEQNFLLTHWGLNRIEHLLEAMWPHIPISPLADPSLNYSQQIYFHIP
jgi:hypothetical protein